MMTLETFSPKVLEKLSSSLKDVTNFNLMLAAVLAVELESNKKRSWIQFYLCIWLGTLSTELGLNRKKIHGKAYLCGMKICCCSSHLHR